MNEESEPNTLSCFNLDTILIERVRTSRISTTVESSQYKSDKSEIN